MLSIKFNMTGLLIRPDQIILSKSQIIISIWHYSTFPNALSELSHVAIALQITIIQRYNQKEQENLFTIKNPDTGKLPL